MIRASTIFLSAIMLSACAVDAPRAMRAECKNPLACAKSLRNSIENNWTQPVCMYRTDRVLLKMTMERSGKVLSVGVAQGSGNSTFDDSAIRAVYRASPFVELRGLDDNTFHEQFQSVSILFAPEKSAGDAGKCANKYPRPIIEPTSYDDDKAIYTAALENIKNRNFLAGRDLMKKILERFPDGPLTPNVHYWLGELYMVADQPQFEEARKNFKLVVDEFPDHLKVPDALFKLGKISFLMGDNAHAKDYFEEVIKKFPSHPVSTLARDFIGKLPN